jgi:hypothetical protein
LRDALGIILPPLHHESRNVDGCIGTNGQLQHA